MQLIFLKSLFLLSVNTIYEYEPLAMQSLSYHGSVLWVKLVLITLGLLAYRIVDNLGVQEYQNSFILFKLSFSFATKAGHHKPITAGLTR